MGRQTKIQWCTATHNFWYGCRKRSAECAYCYMFRMFDSPRRFAWMPKVLHREHGAPVETERIGRSAKYFDEPLRWKEPEVIFVNSLSDFFDEGVPEQWRQDAMDVIVRAHRHIFILTTKEIDKAAECAEFFEAAQNVCLMPTAGNQYQVENRVAKSMKIPARWHGMSAEPLLGPIDLEEPGGYVWPLCYATREDHDANHDHGMWCDERSLDWVVVGGESGGPEERRLVSTDVMESDSSIIPYEYAWFPRIGRAEWVRSLRDQCHDAGVGFFMKQWGGPRPEAAGRMLDGREWNQVPREWVPIYRAHGMEVEGA